MCEIMGKRANPTSNEVWVHFKGQEYFVLAVAKHSETQEELVIYRSQYWESPNDPKYWARPLKMFMGDVTVDGKRVHRFVRKQIG